MSDRKHQREPPQGRKKKEETVPDGARSAALPAITAPAFDKAGRPSTPEVSVTAPSTDPGEQLANKTLTELDPAAYAGTPDGDPNELASEFHAASGKQMDAGGRLIAPGESRPPPAHLSLATHVARPPRSSGSVPLPPQDQPPTEVEVPPVALARAPRAPAAPPVQKVGGKRKEPGRWVLNRGKQGQDAPELRADEEELGASHSTIRRPPPPRTRRRIVWAALGAIVLLLGAGLGGVWLVRMEPAEPDEPVPSSDPAPPPTPAALRLRITSRPSNATVRINGVTIGSTPVDIESPFAPEAELEIEVVLRGYRAWSKRFPAGKGVTTHAQLKSGR